MSILLILGSSLVSGLAGLIVSVSLVGQGVLPAFWGPVAVPTIAFLASVIIGLFLGTALESLVARFWLRKFWGRGD